MGGDHSMEIEEGERPVEVANDMDTIIIRITIIGTRIITVTITTIIV